MKKSFLLFLFCFEVAQVFSSEKLPMYIQRFCNKHPDHPRVKSLLQTLTIYDFLRNNQHKRAISMKGEINQKFIDLLQVVFPALSNSSLRIQREFWQNLKLRPPKNILTKNSSMLNIVHPIGFHSAGVNTNLTHHIGNQIPVRIVQTNSEFNLDAYRPKINFSSYVGGVPERILDLKSILDGNSSYSDVGVYKPFGILFYGPPGTGKTMLAEAMAGELNAAYIYKSGSEFIDKWVGSGPKALRDMLDEAKEIVRRIKLGQITEFSRVVIFIDEIDSIGGKRIESSTGGSREDTKTINQLMTILDGKDFEGKDLITFIVATNMEDNLDGALKRAGRFDWKIKIALPDVHKRRALFDFYLNQRGEKALDADIDNDLLDYLARNSSGCNCADIKLIVNDAAMSSARLSQKINKATLQHALEEIRVKTDFNKYMVGNKFENYIGSIPQEIRDLKGVLSGQDEYTRVGLKKPNIVVLHGPAGTGKSILARTLAGELGSAFVYSPGSDLYHQNLTYFFENVISLAKRINEGQIKEFSSIIVFINEIDSLFGSNVRNYDVGEFLKVLNRFISYIEKNLEFKNLITFIVSTNRSDIKEAIESIDKTLWKIEVKLPNNQKILQLLDNELKKRASDISNDDLNLISIESAKSKLSCKDIENMIERASLFAARESTAINTGHLKAALDVIRPSNNTNPLVS